MVFNEPELTLSNNKQLYLLTNVKKINKYCNKCIAHC